MFSSIKNLAKPMYVWSAYNIAAKKIFRNAFTVANNTKITKQYLFSNHCPQQTINYNLSKKWFSQISTSDTAIKAVKIKSIDQNLWANSDFHKSYKYSPENWDVEGVITPSKGKYHTDCICIDKVISLYENEILPKELNNPTLNDEFECLGTSIVFGELKDKSAFFIEYYTNGDSQAGIMLVAPDWESLIDNIDDNSIYILIKNLHKDTKQQIREKINNMPHDQSVRNILKTNIN